MPPCSCPTFWGGGGEGGWATTCAIRLAQLVTGVCPRSQLESLYGVTFPIMMLTGVWRSLDSVSLPPSSVAVPD